MSSSDHHATTNGRGAGDGKPSRQGLAGRKLGPYLITGELGKGGMGVVYSAEDTALARKVAIKILPAHPGHDDEFIKRFIREARAAAKLDHPGIVQVYQAGRLSDETGSGPCFIAMQHVEGESLGDLVRREGRLSPARALDIARQVAEALGAAHAAGLVHRDVKSGNILVGSDGRVKVTDFGLATGMGADRNRITETGAYLGTPEYSSPEQCEGKELDGRSDIYSLGVVLYEMLTGRVPFEAQTPYKLFDKIVHEPPKPISQAVPGLPRELLAMIDRMMAKDRGRRYANAEELLSAMRRVRAAVGTMKRRPSAGRINSVRRRRRAAIQHGPTVLLIVALLLGLAAWGLWARRPRPEPPPPEEIAQPVPPEEPVRPVLPPPEKTAGTSVVIFDLEDLTGKGQDIWLSHGIPRILISKMSSCQGLEVFSHERVAAALREADGSRIEAARRLGAELMVSGSFLSSDEGLQIDLQVSSVETGSLVTEAVTVRGRVEQVLSLADRLGEGLRSRFDSFLSDASRGNKAGRVAMRFRGAEECLFSVAAGPSDGMLATALADGVDAELGRSRRASAEPAVKEASDTERKADLKAAPAAPAPPAAKPEKGKDDRAHDKAGTAPDDASAHAAPQEGAEKAESNRTPAATAGRERASEAVASHEGSDGVEEQRLEQGPAGTSGAATTNAPVEASAREPETRGGWVYGGGAVNRRDKTPPTASPAPVRAHDRLAALRIRFEGEHLLETAITRADFSRALAKLVNSASLVPDQPGLDGLIAKAKAGLDSAPE